MEMWDDEFMDYLKTVGDNVEPKPVEIKPEKTKEQKIREKMEYELMLLGSGYRRG